ncbi:MAG: HD domain-containing protein, partial [Elusimicrobiota bacterium]
MDRNLLFKIVKDDGVTKETFIEHAIKTYHVGSFLFNELGLGLKKEKYLFCCFFHDVGKLVTSLGKPHTTKSREGLKLIKSLIEYPIILKNFELNDFSEDMEAIQAIENHHDSKDILDGFVSIADQIASSISNYDLKNRLKKNIPTSTMITYLNEVHNFNKYNFYYLSIPSFSKNELNSTGKLLLLKLLYEAIDELNDVKLVYETLDGCRIVTTHSLEELKAILYEKFNSILIEFFKQQDIKKIIGGAPDGFRQYSTLPKEIKPKLVELTVEKYKQDILDALKKKKIDKLEDIGISEEILFRFAKLPELKDYYSNIRGTKYALLASKDGRYSKWVVQTFKIKGKQVEANIVEHNTP